MGIINATPLPEEINNPGLLDSLAAINGLGPLVYALSGKHLLLTGAKGYLGRHVVRMLNMLNEKVLPKPCHITALDSNVVGPTSKVEEWLNMEHLQVIQHNVGLHTLGSCQSILGPAKIDFVLHLAGIASPVWYERLPLETIDVAVAGTRQMLELAKEHQARFLLTSSSEVYQTANVVPTPESYVGAVPSFTSRSCYDVSKLMAETLCHVFYTKYGVDTRVIRIFNSFGVGMGEHDRRILVQLARALIRNVPLTVYASGVGGSLPRRTYTPVANTLSGLFRVLLGGHSGEVVNVGLNTPEVTVPELVERVNILLGSDLRCELVPPPSNYVTEPLRRCPDITRLKGLGFLPVVDLDTGLHRYFQWALNTYTGEA